MTHRVLRTLLVLGFTATIAACGSSVKLDENANAGAGGAGAGSGAIAGAGGSASDIANDPFNPQSPLAQRRSVYFDFNSFSVPEQYRPVVELHSRYLLSRPQQRVRIEGNADERGSTEYNLALGQRRSESVRRMLLVMGVRDDQVEAVSLGKERPRATGGTEADFAENRRADFAYQR